MNEETKEAMKEETKEEENLSDEEKLVMIQKFREQFFSDAVIVTPEEMKEVEKIGKQLVEAIPGAASVFEVITAMRLITENAITMSIGILGPFYDAKVRARAEHVAQQKEEVTEEVTEDKGADNE